MTEFTALFRRHRALGYSVRMSYRLAKWCLEPVNDTKEKA